MQHDNGTLSRPNDDSAMNPVQRHKIEGQGYHEVNRDEVLGWKNNNETLMVIIRRFSVPAMRRQWSIVSQSRTDTPAKIDE